MGYVAEVAQGASPATQDTFICTVTRAPGPGSVIIGRIVVDAGQDVLSVADDQGNTWNIDRQTAPGPCSCIVSTEQDVGKLQIGDDITVTLSGAAGQSSGIFDEFDDIDTTAAWVDKTAEGSDTGTGRDAGTTAVTAQARELVVGAFAIPGVETSLVEGPTYLIFDTPFLVEGGTSVAGEYKYVETRGAQNPTATGGVSVATKGVVVTYLQKPPANPLLAVQPPLGFGAGW